MTIKTGYAGPGKPVVGILGGMGPLATADFMAKLAARTPVTLESDHLPLVVWSNPEIPDRTAALLGMGPSPVPAMADGIARLVAMGARTVAVPCNTAHAFFAEIRAIAPVDFFDMIDLTLAEVVARYPEARQIGVLSTQGTRLAGLYASECRRRGLEVVEPTDEVQLRLVDRAIQQVKTGSHLSDATARIQQATEALALRGATVVIAGCTEIPMVIAGTHAMLPVIDATDCLAAAVVKHSQGHGGTPEGALSRGADVAALKPPAKSQPASSRIRRI